MQNRTNSTFTTKITVQCPQTFYVLQKPCPSPFNSVPLVESNEHYLVYCPSYNEIRSIKISKLPDPPNGTLLLFGSPNLSNNDNKYIFLYG